MNDYVGGSNGGIGRSLSLLGSALIATATIAQFSRHELAIWALAASLVACVARVLLVVVRINGQLVSLFFLAIMVAGGTLPAPSTGAASLVVAAVAVLWL